MKTSTLKMKLGGTATNRPKEDQPTETRANGFIDLKQANATTELWNEAFVRFVMVYEKSELENQRLLGDECLGSDEEFFEIAAERADSLVDFLRRRNGNSR